MLRERRELLVDTVCKDLSTLVGRYARSDRNDLPTTGELSAHFGVSRTVLREAISRLKLQGLIEVKHGVGLRVCNQLHRPVTASVTLLVPDEAERLRQTMEARLLVEVEIARLAAARIDESGLNALHEAQVQLASAESNEEAVDADIEFHRSLAAASGNQVLALMLESITSFGKESRKVTIARAGVPQAHRTHEIIIDALKRHDSRGAVEAMRGHLHLASRDLPLQGGKGVEKTGQ